MLLVLCAMLNKAKSYLQDTLGSNAVSEVWGLPWPEAAQLPFFLHDRYIFYQADLLGSPCLLMVNRAQQRETPAVVRKHWQAVSKHFAGDVVYVVDAVDAYNRKRLIEQGVPFLVPGNQLYLPMLGIDLREYFRARGPVEKARLSMVAQVMVLREVLHHDCAGRAAKELAALFTYSQMAVSRAIRELAECQLVEVEAVGREKHLRFPLVGRALWENAQPLLQSPVKKRVWVAREAWHSDEDILTRCLAGEAALAHYTSLADSGVTHWAVTSQEWAAFTKHKKVGLLASGVSEELTAYGKDGEAIQLELWAYPPHVLARSPAVVDPLSLWLSFEKNTDERIEIAREALLEQVWSAFPW